MSSFTIPLNAPEATLSTAGGKGVNLAEMLRAGFPVPPGFLVTTAAYRAFVAANGLEGQITELVRPARTNDPTTLEAAAQAIFDLFDQGALPEDITKEIAGGYRQLTDASQFPEATLLPVAVRSSATAEDLPGASFAGQQDTYLNVRGEAALLEAVKRCWASLWTARAMIYRARHGIDPAMVSLAVVVQQMVAADAAGVLFTANPMTGFRDEIVINAAWGLGEAIVAGQVTPDLLILDKATGRVNQVDIATKDVMTVLTDQGTVEAPVESRQRQQPVLSEAQVAELARLGSAIETHFGAPQDVEWAIAGMGIYILQSRPVTSSLGPAPVWGEDGEESAVPGDDEWPALGEWSVQPFDGWTLANIGELWPEPVSPLVASTIPMLMCAAVRASFRGVNPKVLHPIQWAKRFYGRMYYNEGAQTHLLSQEIGLPASLIDRSRGNTRGSESKLRPLQVLRRLPVILRLATRQWRSGRQLEALLPQIDRWVADFLGRSLDEQSDRELLAEALLWMDRTKQVLQPQNELGGLSMAALGVLDRLTINWFDREDLVQDLITGLAGIQATEMGAELWQMAQKLDELGLAHVVLDNDPNVALDELRQTAESEPVIKLLETFLEHYGHRSPNETEWIHPCWADAPEQIIELAAAYLRSGIQFDFAETEARQRRRREDAVGWVESRLGPLRREIFRRALTRAHHAARLRENGKSYVIKTTFPARRITAFLGKRWTSRGWLDQPEDVFFLTLPDLQQIVDAGDPATAGFDLSALVAARRQAFEHWFEIEAPADLGPDGKRVALRPVDEPSGRVLQGIAVSAGRVRGPARIIRNPRQAFHMQPSEILVTRATNAGWTPVFPLISGVVTELGGHLSHAAILAREYGLPAVVSVNSATRLIRDGQTITLDGTTGQIQLEGAEETP